jgi:hypothetical protein
VEVPNEMLVMPLRTDVSCEDMFADESDFEFEMDNSKEAGAGQTDVKPNPVVEELLSKQEKAAIVQPSITQVKMSHLGIHKFIIDACNLIKLLAI